MTTNAFGPRSAAGPLTASKALSLRARPFHCEQGPFTVSKAFHCEQAWPPPPPFLCQACVFPGANGPGTNERSAVMMMGVPGRW